MTFRVGQKVVCINGTFVDPRWYRCETQPKEGAVYTIRGFAPPGYGAEEPDVDLIYLEEIVNQPVEWSTGIYELAWGTARFRPVVERKTDISIFTEILNGTRVPERHGV